MMPFIMPFRYTIIIHEKKISAMGDSGLSRTMKAATVVEVGFPSDTAKGIKLANKKPQSSKNH
jgi:hypothetical protein